MHLCQIAAELERKGVDLQVLDQSVDTTTPTGRLFFNMLGAIAQFETEIRAERQMDDIQNAKARDVLLGRRQALTSEQVGTLQTARKQGTLIPTLMRDFKVSKSTVYRYLDGVVPDHVAAAGNHR